VVGNQIESFPITRTDEFASLPITVGADCGGPKRGNSAIKTLDVGRDLRCDPTTFPSSALYDVAMPVLPGYDQPAEK
jgi:hypothetical protein